MPLPSENLIVGSFTSDASSQIIDLNPLHNVLSVDLANITKFGSAAASTEVMTAHWELGYTNGWALRQLKTNGAATLQIPSMVTTLGISVLDTADQTPGPLVATGTAISQAATAVVSDASTTTLTANSTVVRMINTTGMLQIAGMDFTVGTVNAGVSFQLRYLDSSGFGAAATNADWRIVPFDPQFYPRRRYITGITQAASAVITMSVAHEFSVGETVRIFNPDSNFGMGQINGQLGTITAVTTGATNTITVDIDSSAYSAFAFPTSAVAAAGITFPQVIPVGDPNSSLVGATSNQSSRRILIESNALGATSDVMRYQIRTY
jgi:hypothetical protein